MSNSVCPEEAENTCIWQVALLIIAWVLRQLYIERCSAINKEAALGGADFRIHMSSKYMPQIMEYYYDSSVFVILNRVHYEYITISYKSMYFVYAIYSFKPIIFDFYSASHTLYWFRA